MKSRGNRDNEMGALDVLIEKIMVNACGEEGEPIDDCWETSPSTTTPRKRYLIDPL